MIVPLVLLGAFLALNQPIYAIVDTPLALLGIFLSPRLYNYYTIRRSRLRADWKAAEIVGRDQFIRVLVKIDGFHILDLEELKRTKRTVWQRHVFPWPTMIERLDNLRVSWKPPE